jgi:hypothetical protein
MAQFFSAVIVTREESVLARQSLRAHRTFDNVGVELDAAIIEEANEAVKMPQPIAKPYRSRPRAAPADVRRRF